MSLVTRLIGLGALGVLSSLLAFGCGGGPKHPRGPLSLTLPTLDGQRLDVSALGGRPAVLHLFTTWSLTAQGDLPQLFSAHEEFAGRAAIIGLALDLDGAELVGPWQRSNRVSYPIALADRRVLTGDSALGKLDAVPTTVVLRADGRVAHWIARPLRDGELARLLRGLVASR